MNKMATYIRSIQKLSHLKPFRGHLTHPTVTRTTMTTVPMCSSPQLQDPQNRFHLLASVSIERKPVITSDLTPLEVEFSKILSQIELENSLLNDHEMRHIEDMQRKKRLTEGATTESDLEASIQTAQDFEDLANEEIQKFDSASRITEADERNDQKSLNRCLQQHLSLLIKCKSEAFLSGAFGDWQLPFAKYETGETLRQTAERAVKEHFGSELRVNVFGNAPIGFYKLKYSKKYKVDGIEGAKVFFFRAHYVKGDVVSNVIEDHRWVTRDEMEQLLGSNPKYRSAVKSFTYDDRFTYEPSNNLVKNSVMKSVLKVCN